MQNRTDGHKQSILKALDRLEGPAGGTRIEAALKSLGVNLSPRTVRHYLRQLDAQGLTRTISRRMGRGLTELGRMELASANIIEKLGFVAARVDTLGYRMTFDLNRGRGTIVMNVALIEARDLPRALLEMAPVVRAGLGMGRRMAIARAGETLAGVTVPRDQVAFGTPCSVTVNGILLKAGIPATSRFGGLVEMRRGQLIRFVQLIEYRGTTIDPLEIFMRARTTQVRACAATGTGIIGASLREVPSAAADEVRKLHAQMAALDLPALLEIGRPNQPLRDIPVTEGKTGMLVTAGMNPVAALFEAGIHVSLHPLVGLEDYERLRPFEELALLGRRDSPLID